MPYGILPDGTRPYGTPPVYGNDLSVSSTGTASLSALRSLLKTLSASSTGTATITKVRTLLRTLTASATGTASIVRSVWKTLAAASTGSASLALTKTFSVALTAMSVAVADLRQIMFSTFLTRSPRVILNDTVERLIKVALMPRRIVVSIARVFRVAKQNRSGGDSP